MRHHVLRLATSLCLIVLSGSATYSEPTPDTEEPAVPTEATSNDTEGANETGTDSPSIQLTGSVWRSKPGIVFLQTPVGLLSLSSKTGLRDIKASHKITLWVDGPHTAIDIRDRQRGSLVHRYLSGIARYAAPDKKHILLWTPEGERAFAVGSHGGKIAADSPRPVTVEVNEAGAITGIQDLQFDLQVSQVPKTDSATRLRLTGTVSKLKSSFVFLKTPVGIVTVSTKTGVRNAKVGQEMTLWVHGDRVAIDLYQGTSTTAPVRRFLTGRLVYATPDKHSVMLWTPEGDRAFRADHQGKGSLASLKEGAAITVELDQHGDVVDIRRLN